MRFGRNRGVVFTQFFFFKRKNTEGYPKIEIFLVIKWTEKEADRAALVVEPIYGGILMEGNDTLIPWSGIYELFQMVYKGG